MPDQNLRISSQPLNTYSGIVSLAGRLDAGSLDAFEDEVNGLIDSGVTSLGIDAVQLDGISSAGLGAFVDLASLLRERQGLFMLCIATPELTDLVDMLGLRDILGVTDNIDTVKRELMKPK